MKEENLTQLSKELLEILKAKGKLTIEEMLEWIRSKGGSTLILSVAISELESNNLIKKLGNWEKSEPLFPLPQAIELINTEVQKVKVEEKRAVEKKDEMEEKLKEYFARYYSVGELRIRLDFANKLKEIDPFLKKLEEKGLIVWNRELGVVTATDELLNEYRKNKSLLDVF